MRILIAVTHLLGAGHLTRAAAIGRALVRAGHEVTLMSGGMPAALIDVRGLTFIQLPPVRAAADSFVNLVDEADRPVGQDRLLRRRDLLLDALALSDPDAVVTELYPFGRRVLAAEFGALVEAARLRRPRPLIVSSVRDILVAPGKPEKVETVHQRLRDAFDAVLVHGEEHIVPLEASWPLASDLRPRLVYTGYVDGSASDQLPPSGGVARRSVDEVLVSGGSSAASLPLYRAAIAAARLAPALRWRLLVGHGVAPADYEALSREAGPAAVERARPDFRDRLSQAAVFVGQAGYNTVMDLLATRVPAVLVPFERGQETEQRARAAELARRGYADLLPEAELEAQELLRRVQAAIGRAWPAGSEIRLDGAERAAAVLGDLVATQRRAARDGGGR